MLLGETTGLSEITFLTVRVTFTATVIAALAGIPLGYLMGTHEFRGRRIVIALANTGMGLPPVVVGILVALLLSRNGPFGAWTLIYTPAAIIVAQVVIALPIIAGLTAAGIQGLSGDMLVQIRAMAAGRTRTMWLVLREARASLVAALLAGFGGAVSEVGASMMVGGNIEGQTRVLTTAAVLETSKGNFGAAIGLGAVLLVLAFGVNLAGTLVQLGEAGRG
ncbi:MAG: ABC transporter permease [Deltaproteobacteria bacterium]|nr:ABC transporter permease [Deltaproteobacteria bacterium]